MNVRSRPSARTDLRPRRGRHGARAASVLARLALAAALASPAALAGCGNKIGDSCSQSVDCSSEGDRLCDTASPGGYCTIEGCDFGTCPDEAVCVRFFPISHLTATCTDDLDCGPDEFCVTGGRCAPRSTERRFCMLRCSGHGDCRGDYECRDDERMGAHGGEPVPDPDDPDSADKPSFCASSTTCRTDDDCDLGDTCQLSGLEGRCSP